MRLGRPVIDVERDESHEVGQRIQVAPNFSPNLPRWGVDESLHSAYVERSGCYGAQLGFVHHEECALRCHPMAGPEVCNCGDRSDYAAVVQRQGQRQGAKEIVQAHAIGYSPHPPFSFTGKVVWSDPVIGDIRAKALAVMTCDAIGFCNVDGLREVVDRDGDGWWDDLRLSDVQKIAALLLALHEAFHGF